MAYGAAATAAVAIAGYLLYATSSGDKTAQSMVP
jgi:hypothetical protein